MCEILGDDRIAVLVTEALNEATSEERYDEILTLFQQSSSQAVFNTCVDLCRSKDSSAIIFACNVLRELGTNGTHPFGVEASMALSSVLERTSDECVIVAALDALGWQGVQEFRWTLYRYAHDQRSHVRDAVASNITSMWSSEADQQAISLLLDLARDEDSDVRASAVWALAKEVRSKSQEVVRALTRVADDKGEELTTREVAKEGLGNLLVDD